LVVGINVAKDKNHAFMGSATSTSLLRNLLFENNLEGFRKLLERSGAIRIQNPFCHTALLKLHILCPIFS
jgi:transposase